MTVAIARLRLASKQYSAGERERARNKILKNSLSFTRPASVASILGFQWLDFSTNGEIVENFGCETIDNLEVNVLVIKNLERISSIPHRFAVDLCDELVTSDIFRPTKE